MMSSSQEQLLRPKAIKVLEIILKERNINNYKIQVSSGVEKGQNFAAIIARVNVNGYDNKGETVHKSFIIKSAPVNEVRNVGHVRDGFLREIYTYSKLFREFDVIQEEKRVVNSFKSYPEYYTSNSENGEESIVLQDLKLCGYKHYNREMPADFEHAALVMKEYGRLHALSYAIHDQKPQLFEDIINNTYDICFQNFQKPVVRVFSKHRVEQALNSLDPIKDETVYEKFRDFSENMFEILSKCINSKSIDEHAVVIHGDCSLSNFMFKYEDFDNSNKPTTIQFLDWQLTRLGSPAMDLATVIFSSTDKKLRDLHYDDLINEYYNSLCSMLKQLGTDPIKMLPFEVLQQHLKKYSICGLFMATLLVFLQSAKKDEIPDMLNDTTELYFELKQIESYNVRMRDIILDYDRFGYNFTFD